MAKLECGEINRGLHVNLVYNLSVGPNKKHSFRNFCLQYTNYSS